MNNNEPVKMESSKQLTCSTGGCGGAGMCPGIALAVSYGLWLVVAATGIVWLAWILAVPAFLLLVTGYWRRLTFLTIPKASEKTGHK